MNEEAENQENDEDEEDTVSDLCLVFTAEGGCILEEDGEPVWFSDDDDDFAEQFGDDFLTEEDSREVLNYLEEEGLIDPEEKPEVDIEQENGDDEDARVLED